MEVKDTSILWYLQCIFWKLAIWFILYWWREGRAAYLAHELNDIGQVVFKFNGETLVYWRRNEMLIECNICVCECTRVRVCVCVCERERERGGRETERGRKRLREGWSGSVWVWESELFLISAGPFWHNPLKRTNFWDTRLSWTMTEYISQKSSVSYILPVSEWLHLSVYFILFMSMQ